MMSHLSRNQHGYAQVSGSSIQEAMEPLSPTNSGITDKRKLIEIRNVDEESSESIDSSIKLIGLITFVGDSSRGILYPVLFKLTTRLGGSTIDLGYIVAIFSIGRLVSSTPFGYLCDRQRHRLPLQIANITLLCGAILWANALITKSLNILFIAQFILGLASGTLGLTRSYVVERVHPKKRTEMISLLTALQYAGFTVSPILGAGVAWLGSTYSEYLMYALPGYVIACLSCLCIVGLFTFFENIPIPTPADQPSSSEEVLSLKESGNSQAELTESEQSLDIDRTNQWNTHLLIIAMIFLNFTTKGSIAVYETLGSEILIDDYDFTVFPVGSLVSIGGTIGTIQLILFKSFWSKQLSDLQLMLGGIIVMILAQLILLSYGAVPGVERFIVGMLIMYGVGYPIGHTAIIAAFSKIQKSGPQAALMSWFATAGSLARVAVPISSDYIDVALDNGPFCVVLMAMAISYSLIICLRPIINYYIASDVLDESILPPSIFETKNLEEYLQIFVMTAIAAFAVYALMNLMPGPG
jgi:MFS transporter, ceroid-lipofuscinosis neuronal protein 7